MSELQFHVNFPIIIEQLTNVETLNPILEQDIRTAGNAFEDSRNSSAKCLMTRWDMHKEYESFAMIGDAAIRLAKLVPMAKRTRMDGTSNPVELEIDESWGLIYTQGQETGEHSHWPSLWSYTYCVKGCSKCAPFTFIDVNVHKKYVKPKIGQMVLFPSWLLHRVPNHTCDHERIMISGNLKEYKDA